MEATWALQSIELNATKRMLKGICDEDGLLDQAVVMDVIKSLL